jgi:3-phosphoshikimate 1-carboxyvinyltransferase
MSALALEAPPSKSMTQRALIIAALADGPSRIDGPLDCDDARYLVALLEALGTTVRWHERTIEIEPQPLRAPIHAVFCGNAGTTVRFGAALSALVDGTLRLDGDEHMRQRPMGPLDDALAALGIEVVFEGEPARVPLALSRRWPPAARAVVDGSISSQFASGLMLVAPKLPEGLAIDLEGEVVSRPYLEMTAAMMRRAGATVESLDGGYRVARGGYRSVTFAIEPDWSAAAFLLAAGRIAEVEIDCSALPPASLQGDAAFADMLTTLAAPPAGDHYHFDLTDTPDLIAPLCALCLFASHPSKIRGAAHTRLKESDRVAVLARELGKIGARIDPFADGLDVAPLSDGHEAALDPQGDHRMAMAFGLVGLRVPLSIADRECVGKSFPDFWSALDRIASRAVSPVRGGG